MGKAEMKNGVQHDGTISVKEKSTFHLDTVKQKIPISLKCTKLLFDVNKINTDWVRISEKGVLLNFKSAQNNGNDERFKLYRGTSSTSPLSQAESPQYWETVSSVRIDPGSELEGTEIVLETGLSWMENQDQSRYISEHPQSYSLTVSHCIKHNGICRKVWKLGRHVHCLPDTFPNKPGPPVNLHFGFVFDYVRSKMVFIDVTEKKVIAVIGNVNVNPSCLFWAMFGVCNPHMMSVNMKLIAGDAIDVSNEKKTLIRNALVSQDCL